MVSIEVVVVMCLQVGLAEASQMSLKRERLGKFVLTHTVQAQFDNKGLQKHRIHNNRHDVHNAIVQYSVSVCVSHLGQTISSSSESIRLLHWPVRKL